MRIQDTSTSATLVRQVLHLSVDRIVLVSFQSVSITAMASWLPSSGTTAYGVEMVDQELTVLPVARRSVVPLRLPGMQKLVDVMARSMSRMAMDRAGLQLQV